MSKKIIVSKESIGFTSLFLLLFSPEFNYIENLYGELSLVYVPLQILYYFKLLFSMGVLVFALIQYRRIKDCFILALFIVVSVVWTMTIFPENMQYVKSTRE